MDYDGYRVLAVAKVPISKPLFTGSGKFRRSCQDMVHGTPDGGDTVLNENRVLDSKLKAIAQRLNLSLHSVKVRRRNAALHSF